jgi:tetratricopeptide (TPR) repeat protein
VRTDDPTPDEGIPGQRAERWRRIRHLAKSISAIIAAIGIASAGIGYITSGVQFFSRIAEYFEGQSEVRSLIATGEERLTRTDFEAAWTANAKARQLAPRNAAAAAQQAQIAMKWLENVRLSSAGGPKSFGEVVDPLKVALIERLAGARGREKADIQAHIGWANFLRYRDGRPKADIVEEFDAAINEDPDNLYGHVMRGFWILWDGGAIDKARGDFDVALRSSTDPAYSDMLIMSALTNSQADDSIAAAIEYADTIRQAGRNIDDPTKSTLIWYYSICLRSKNLLETISRKLPASEQALFLEWLKQANIALHDKRVATYFMAYFAENDGKREEALQLYNDVVRTSPDKGEDITRLAQGAVNRLQKR